MGQETVAVTVARRLEAWRHGHFEQLMLQAEAHATECHAARESQRAATLRDKLAGVVRKQTPRVQEAIRAVQSGAPSKAMQALLAEPQAAPTPEAFAKLQKLHPAAEKDKQRRAPPQTTAVTFKKKDVIKAIRSFGKLTSGAIAGMRAEHAQAMLEALPESADAFTALVNHYSNGGVPHALRRYFFGASLTGLAKPDDGVRPVACGDFLRRLTSKLVARHVTSLPVIKKMFLLHQFGVGCKLGTERLIHRIRRDFAAHAKDADYVLVKADWANAFNMVSRAAFLNKVAELAPEAYAYIEASYDQPTLLRALQFEHLAQSTIESQAGCQQGDPLGPLLYCIATIALVEAINKAAPLLSLNVHYLDDGVLAGPVAQVKAALRLLQAEGAALGCVLNPKKCEAISHFPGQGAEHFAATGADCSACGDTKHDIRLGVIRTDGNFDILGAPIGTEAHCYSFVTDETVNPKAPLARVRKVCAALKSPLFNHTQCGFLLLQKCVAFSRGVYLARTTPPAAAQRALAEMDAEIEATLDALLGSPLRIAGKRQARLGIGRGGLGIRSSTEHASACYVASVIECARADSWSPKLAEGFLDSTDNILRAAGMAVNDANRNTVWQMPSSEQETLQHRFSELITEQSYKELLEGVGVTELDGPTWSDEKMRRARMNSVGTGKAAGAWLLAVPSAFFNTEMTNSQFSVAVRLRLGERVLTVERKCNICGSAMDAYGYHATTCKGRGSLGARHNHVRDVIYRLMRTASMAPKKEVCFRSVTGAAERPADLFYSPKDGRDVAIDVAVTHPMQAKFAAGAAKEPCFAANEYARVAKTRKYAVMLDGKQVLKSHHDVTLVPIVFETFGAANKETAELVETIARGWAVSAQISLASARERTQQHIAVALQRYNAAMVIDRRYLAEAPASDAVPQVLEAHTDPRTGEPTLDVAAVPLEPVAGAVAPTPSTTKSPDPDKEVSAAMTASVASADSDKVRSAAPTAVQRGSSREHSPDASPPTEPDGLDADSATKLLNASKMRLVVDEGQSPGLDSVRELEEKLRYANEVLWEQEQVATRVRGLITSAAPRNAPPVEVNSLLGGMLLLEEEYRANARRRDEFAHGLAYARSLRTTSLIVTASAPVATTIPSTTTAFFGSGASFALHTTSLTTTAGAPVAATIPSTTQAFFRSGASSAGVAHASGGAVGARAQ